MQKIRWRNVLILLSVCLAGAIMGGIFVLALVNLKYNLW